MKKIKRKTTTKRKIKRTKKTFKGGTEILYGLIGYFLGIFFINFASKGAEEGITFNPIQAAEFFSVQISTIVGLPRFITLAIGFLLTLVPLLLFYVLSKEFIVKRK